MGLLSVHSPGVDFPVIFPRERDAAVIVRSFLGGKGASRRSLPVLLIHGPDGACPEGVVGISLGGRLSRFCQGGRRPGVVSLHSSSWLKNEPEPVAKMILILIEKHPFLRSGRMCQSRVRSLLGLATSHPLDAGRSLGRYLNQEEQRHAGGETRCRIKLIIQFEGVDRLFESEGLNSKETDELRGFRDLLGFIQGLTAQQSVIFSMCGHSWVIDRLFAVARHAGIEERGLFVHEVGFPERKEICGLVSGLVESLASELKFGEGGIPLTDLTEAIVEDFLLYPACIRLLPELLVRIREEAEILEKPLCILDYTGIERLSGVIRERAEKVFREQGDDEEFRSILTLSKISKKTAQHTGCAISITDDKSLERAFYWKSKGILSLQLSSGGGKVFRPSHPDLFLKWERVRAWSDEAFIEEMNPDSSGQSPLRAEEKEGRKRSGDGNAVVGNPFLMGLGIIALAMLLAVGFMAMANRSEDEGFVLDKPSGLPVEFRSTSSKIHSIVPTE